MLIYVGRVTPLGRGGALWAIVLEGRLTDPGAQRREANGPRVLDTSREIRPDAP